MSYFDDGFKVFAKGLETILADQPDYTSDELIRHQRRQIRNLVDLETRFRKILLAHRDGPATYRAFVDLICKKKGNILSARPYFRERQETFTAYISKALKAQSATGLYKFKVNWTFISWVLNSRQWKNKELLDIAEQIQKARNELLEQNLPLAISQARGFYAATPRSHLSFMDVVQIQCQGLLLAIDKFCPPDEKGMTDQESLDAYQSFRAVAIGIMRRDRVNDYSQTLMHFFPKDRQMIYWINKMMRQFVNEVDHGIVSKEINRNLPEKEAITPETVADLIAAATTVSADYVSEPDGESVVDLAAADASFRPDNRVEATDLTQELGVAIKKGLTLTETKLLQLKGITCIP